MIETPTTYPNYANKCGVCDKKITAFDRFVGKQEKNGIYTFYCMDCETEAKSLKPCKHCGHHRKTCKCKSTIEREPYGSLGGRTNSRRKRNEREKSRC
ncbi:hypothetical protein COF68_06310 [Bacillus toyonensis]|uniref:hypothetical protein n=1 Tax=Bacillus toyonensis TaxID=155322 RepID=UPI000BFE7B8C|nr:hypothetical protein [Bacillus toyonensis]PHE64447.1 hypothetical protein COF68_06310 [Bacillus toyonensis]